MPTTPEVTSRGIATGVGIVTRGIGGGGTALEAVPWRVPNSIATIADIARPMVGIPNTATDPSLVHDRYSDLWDSWITLARDDVVAEVFEDWNPMRQAEYRLKVTAGQEYDLMQVGFMKIEKVGYGPSDDQIRWLPIYDRAFAMGFAGRDTHASGEPFMVFADGIATLGIIKVPTDKSQELLVYGPRAAPPVKNQADLSMLPSWCNEVIALGASIRACEYDYERTWMAMVLRTQLQERYERQLSLLRVRVRTWAPETGGFTVGQGATDALRTRRRRWGGW